MSCKVFSSGFSVGFFTFDVCMFWGFFNHRKAFYFYVIKITSLLPVRIWVPKIFPILWFLKNSIYIFFPLHNFISVKDALVPKEFKTASENTC